MKILFLSDLHLEAKRNFGNDFLVEKTRRSIEAPECDVVCITGDVFEYTIYQSGMNPFILLSKLFPEKEIVFTLGNHEFAYSDFAFVKSYWSGIRHWNVHCLDVEGHFDIDGIRFVGNVLWYDFTMGKIHKDYIIPEWLDSTISGFDPKSECEKCKNEIKSNLSKDMKNILLTHTCPHSDLNAFNFDNPFSIPNNYSGCNDFLREINDFPIEFSVCGHTHRRAEKEIYGIHCVNLGNDYFWNTNKTEKMVVELC